MFRLNIGDGILLGVMVANGQDATLTGMPKIAQGCQ